MYLVGLTGGIGSGKSTVAARLQEHGCEVIDADLVAREVVEPGGPVLEALAARFGPGVLRADGTLDRAALAEAAFADEAGRSALERITHPAIAGRIAERIAEIDARSVDPDQVVVVDHPLLLETGQAARFDAVVVVLADEARRVERLVHERGMPVEDVRARMRAQVDDATRRDAATHVIENDGSLDELRRRVDEVHARLRSTRAAPRAPRGT